MKTCSYPECDYPVFSHNLCSRHQFLRTDDKYVAQIDRRKQKQAEYAQKGIKRTKDTAKRKLPLRTHKNTTGELALFNVIWNTRAHISFISGVPISHFSTSSFIHILAKGQNKYPLFKLYEKNIVLGTEYEHFILDNGTIENRAKYQQEMIDLGYDCDWGRLFDLKKELIEEYKHQHHE